MQNLVQNTRKYAHKIHNHKVTQEHYDKNKPAPPPRRKRGRPRKDAQLQQQVGDFIQGIRAEVEAAAADDDGGRDGAGADGQQQQGHPHQPQQQKAGCNCEGGVETCPRDGNCLVTNVVYSATVKTLDVLDEAVDEQSYTCRELEGPAISASV